MCHVTYLRFTCVVRFNSAVGQTALVVHGWSEGAVIAHETEYHLTFADDEVNPTTNVTES